MFEATFFTHGNNNNNRKMQKNQWVDYKKIKKIQISLNSHSNNETAEEQSQYCWPLIIEI